MQEPTTLDRLFHDLLGIDSQVLSQVDIVKIAEAIDVESSQTLDEFVESTINTKVSKAISEVEVQPELIDIKVELDHFRASLGMNGKVTLLLLLIVGSAIVGVRTMTEWFSLLMAH